MPLPWPDTTGRFLKENIHLHTIGADSIGTPSGIKERSVHPGELNERVQVIRVMVQSQVNYQGNDPRHRGQ